MDNQNGSLNEKEKPLNLAWLDSSYFETLFPGTPWQNVNDMLSLELAQAVRQQFHNPHRKQMIIELLGYQFKRSYLSDETDNPHLLNPPNMTDEQRRKLENEAKSWLQIQINEIALRKGCAVKADQTEDALCAEMKDYLDHTYNIINTSLDRHLYLKQNQVNVEINKCLQSTNNNEERNILNMISTYSDKNDLREVFKTRKIVQPEEGKKSKLNVELTGSYSEFIAESLLSILQKDPRRIAFVLQKLNGQQLTNNLRKFIWSDILLRHERKKIEANIPVDIDLLVRKNFANGVTRGKNELKLIDPSQTPVSGLIENAVIETYSRVYALSDLLYEQHLRQAMKILNVLYTYSRDYEPYYIYWLLAFQLSFQSIKDKSELIYDLAMYLDLFVKNLFPPWNEIFTIAGKVMQDLSINDPTFYEHLKKISKINPKVNPKDFVNEIIYNENKKAISHLIPNSNEDPIKNNKELLIEPTIFIRKWIGECFAGILRKNSLLYVWDQLFMSLWAAYDFEIITKALLYLLKNQFLMATDHDQMRRVFIEEPCKLYTSDIQSAFMHLSSGRKESDVPYLNRRDKELNGSHAGGKSNDLPNRKKSQLDPIGFKEIRLTLVIPKLGPTSDFDPSRIVVEAVLYYGSLKLFKKQTQSIPLVKDIRSSLNDTKTYEITIINDRLLFEFSGLEQDSNGLREIFALVSVKYRSISMSEFYLGYCTVPLYSPQRIGQVSTWEITQGQITRLLHPGIAGYDVENISDIPTSSYKDRLGPGSSITLNVFDEKSENYVIRFKCEHFQKLKHLNSPLDLLIKRSANFTLLLQKPFEIVFLLCHSINLF